MLFRKVKVDGQNLAPVTLTQHYDITLMYPLKNAVTSTIKRKHGGLKCDHCPILIPQEKTQSRESVDIFQYALLSLDYPTIIIYVYIIYQNNLMSILVV